VEEKKKEGLIRTNSLSLVASTSPNWHERYIFLPWWHRQNTWKVILTVTAWYSYALASVFYTCLQSFVFATPHSHAYAEKTKERMSWWYSWQQ